MLRVVRKAERSDRHPSAGCWVCKYLEIQKKAAVQNTQINSFPLYIFKIESYKSELDIPNFSSTIAQFSLGSTL
jgi:hypothetical protein